MDSDDLILYGVLAVVAFVAFKSTIGKKWDDETGMQALENAGAQTFFSSIPGDTKTYATAGNTTFGFKPGDYEKLNFAQRRLIELDKIVPGTWLTRMVLT